jgi:hypothetical protein
MNKPSLKTRFFGHPIIALSTYAGGAFVLYQWTQDSQVWPLGVVALCAMSATMRASDQVAAYRTWKMAWDAMGDAPLPSGRGNLIIGYLIGSAIIAAVTLYLIDHSNQPSYRLALGWMAITGGGGLVGLLLVKLFRAFPKRKPKAKTSFVTLAITRPIQAVPDLRQCYRNLPEHCHALLHARPSDGVR